MPKRDSSHFSNDSSTFRSGSKHKYAKTAAAGSNGSSEGAGKFQSASSVAAAASSSSFLAPQHDENGDAFWELSNSRRITVNAFKGRWMVNIREYYEAGGKRLPGKKGISLPLEQFSFLIEALPQIEAYLGEKGQRINRPAYDDGPATSATSKSKAKKNPPKPQEDSDADADADDDEEVEGASERRDEEDADESVEEENKNKKKKESKTQRETETKKRNIDETSSEEED